MRRLRVASARRFSQVSKEAKAVQKELETLQMGHKVAKDAAVVANEIKRLENEVRNAGKGFAAFSAQEQIIGQRMIFEKMADEAKRYGVTLDNAAAKASNLAASIEKIQRASALAEQKQLYSGRREEAHTGIMRAIEVAALFKGPIDAAAAYQKSLAYVGTVAGVSQKELKALGAMAEEIGATYARTGTEMNAAMYQGFSAGVTLKDMPSFLRIVAQQAVGGNTDMKTVADGLTTVRNAWGKTKISLQDASDITAQIVAKGKTEVGVLTSYLFNVAPAAAAVGISYREVGAAIATFANQGVPAAQGTTQLRMLMLELANDASGVYKVFEQISGKSFREYMASGGSLKQALSMLQTQANASGVTLDSFFQSVESKMAVMQLSGKNAALFNEQLGYMAETSNAAKAQAEWMMSTPAFGMDKAKTNAEALSVALGTTLVPALGFVLLAVTAILSPFRELAENFPTLATWVGTVAVLFLGLVLATNAVKYAWNSLLLFKTGMQMLWLWMTTGATSTAGAELAASGASFTLAGAFATLTAAFYALPIIGQVAAIVALAAAIVMLFDPIKQLKKLWAWWKGEKYEEPVDQTAKLKKDLDAQKKALESAKSGGGSSALVKSFTAIPGAMDGMDANAVAAITGYNANEAYGPGETDTIHIDKEGKIVKAGARHASSAGGGGSSSGAATPVNIGVQSAPMQSVSGGQTTINQYFQVQNLDEKNIRTVMQLAKEAAMEILQQSTQRSFADATLA